MKWRERPIVAGRGEAQEKKKNPPCIPPISYEALGSKIALQLIER